jgi:hypothetical protein
MLANAFFIGAFIFFSLFWLRFSVSLLLRLLGPWIVRGAEWRDWCGHALLTCGLLVFFALFGLGLPRILELFYKLEDVNGSFVAIVVLVFFCVNWLFSTAHLRLRLADLRSTTRV